MAMFRPELEELTGLCKRLEDGDLVKAEPERLHGYDSWLPTSKREMILARYNLHLRQLREARKHHRSGLHDDRMSSDPAWTSISPTDKPHSSGSGLRLVIGFANKGCGFRDNDPLGLGCLSCGYYAGIRRLPGSQPVAALEEQFIAGVWEAVKRSARPDVIEFLSDGSFLCDREMPEKAKRRILQRVGQMKYIRRVLLESRPEHITEQELEERTRSLDRAQRLEIGIGLESRDDFVREVCIRKAIRIDFFEQKLRLVKEFGDRSGRPISIVCYVLLKPAYLSEQEAVEDAVRTVRYLARLEEEIGIRIVPKIEPAVIARGTILDVLFSEDPSSPTYYSPLSYWTVLELLVRVWTDEQAQPVGPRVRIGAREDMDDVRKMPAIYRKDGKFCQYDYIVYGAIQEFNRHRSIEQVLGTIVLAYRHREEDLLDGPTSSFKEWEGRYLSGEGRTSAVRSFLDANRSTLEQQMRSQMRKPGNRRRRVFRNHLFDVFDSLELHSPGTENIAEAVKQLRRQHVEGRVGREGIRREIATLVRQEFSRNREIDDAYVQVMDFAFEEDAHKLLRILLRITDVRTCDPWESHSVWLGIPAS